MKNLWLFNIVSIAFIIAGVILAIYEISGWGWVMFCAVVCYHSPESKSNDENEN